MFQPVYVVWGLLPAIFVGLAVWTLLRPVFGIHGKESATPFLHTSIFTIFGFVLAIVLDHKLMGDDGSYPTFSGTESEAMILHWTLYPMILLALAYLNKAINRARGKDVPVNLREGLARYQR